MNSFGKLVALSLLLLGCASTSSIEDEGFDTDAFDLQDDEGPADRAQASSRAWQIDARVFPQVGFQYGRSGSDATAPSSSYDAVGQLVLPAAALTDNAIPLTDVEADDLAQIDFFDLGGRAEQRADLAAVFRRWLANFHFDLSVRSGLTAAVNADDFLLKEVRLRAPEDVAYPTVPSAFPSSRVEAFEDAVYASIFITARAQGTSALEAFREDLLEQHAPLYEVGDIADLPSIPHPQNASVLLVKLMTVRREWRGRRLVLEVIETTN